uniref:Uncharacterized protein n=1 Tax=Setaria italica TaxID=4555 RepID=K4AMZ1_SETIT
MTIEKSIVAISASSGLVHNLFQRWLYTTLLYCMFLLAVAIRN